ncbi:hypothetical protein LINGRAPRIM_LOCUS1984, partial [Linum grandiflorum]
MVKLDRSQTRDGDSPETFNGGRTPVCEKEDN